MPSGITKDWLIEPITNEPPINNNVNNLAMVSNTLSRSGVTRDDEFVLDVFCFNW